MNKIKLAGIFAFLLFVCFSCVDTSLDDVGGQVDSNKGWVAFINASPGSQHLKLFSNELGISNTLSYNEFNAYMSVKTGSVPVSVRSGSDDLDFISVNIDKGKYYSMFAVNLPTDTELAFYEDNPVIPNDDYKTMFRFIQLSANTPKVVLKIEGNDGDFGSYNFKQASGFIELNSFDEKLFSLVDAVSGETLVSKKVSFAPRRAYSVFSQGIMGETAQDKKLEIKVIPFN